VPASDDVVSAAIAPQTLADVVRAALEDEDARVTSWRAQQIHGSLGPGAKVYRVIGDAEIAGRSLTHWSFVLKVFSLAGGWLEAANADSNAWDYWKREWLIYRSPWLHRLTGKLRAARCFGTGESGAGYVWIAMEDLTAADDRPWPLARFGIVAQHVGEFNGAHLTVESLPSEDWLSSGWLRGSTERTEPMIGLLPTVADHPLVSRMYPPATIKDLLRVWEERDALFEALDALPQTLCHQDVFPRNVFVVAGEQGEQSVTVDWAFCGLGPVGQDLTALVGASLAFFEADHATADELETQCLRGYLRGLKATGWHGPVEDVEFAYLASLVLRYGVGAIGSVLMFTLDESVHGLVEQGFGRPMGDIVESIRGTVQFQRDRIRRAERLLKSR
jgi:Phosphotransferase enzyme family